MNKQSCYGSLRFLTDILSRTFYSVKINLSVRVVEKLFESEAVFKLFLALFVFLSCNFLLLTSTKTAKSCYWLIEQLTSNRVE